MNKEALNKQSLKDNESYFELATLHFQRTNFDESLKYLKKAADAFYKEENYNEHVRCLNNMIRIYSEKQEFEKVTDIKDQLQDLVIQKKFTLNSRVYYFLGYFKISQGQRNQALEYFERSLDLSTQIQSKQDICYALLGQAAVQVMSDRLDNALNELESVERLLDQVKQHPDIEISYNIQLGNIFKEKKEYQKALDCYWNCYNLLKNYNSMYMYIHVLYFIGSCYLIKGDLVKAKTYLSLAEKITPEKNLKNTYEKITKNLRICLENENENYDIIINSSHRKVIERDKGQVNFKNQFILLDLLKLFTENPGHIYTKEQLTEKIWNQQYSSEKHDNKIYVTIKRLRQLIEPNNKNTKYIFRTKNGYYFNKDLKILKTN